MLKNQIEQGIAGSKDGHERNGSVCDFYQFAATNINCSSYSYRMSIEKMYDLLSADPERKSILHSWLMIIRLKYYKEIVIMLIV